MRGWTRNARVVSVSFTGVISRCGQVRFGYFARTKYTIMMWEISGYIGAYGGRYLRHCADITRQSLAEVAISRMFDRGHSV